MGIGIFGYCNSISTIKDERIYTHHFSNNQTIKELLDTFMTTNNLDYKDFVVCGSSCASYMDYFVLNSFRDVDVFVLNKPREDVILTERIDALPFISSNNYLERLEVRDNFQFISKIDIIISMTISGLRKLKYKNFYYVAVLLIDLGMSLDELIELIVEKELPNLDALSDEVKSTIIGNIPFMKIYITNRMKEISGDLEFKVL